MNTETGRTLIALARNAIAQRLGLAAPAGAFDADWLRATGATYVTLLHEGKLRGSNGTLQAHRSLAEDLMANAIAAACSDLRFAPLTRDEFPQTEIEICLLSAVETLQAVDEAAVVAQLRPGTDGVILEYGRHRSSFLPQMWDQSADTVEFLAQLKYKAGLPPDFWSEDVKIARYTASLWREADLHR